MNGIGSSGSVAVGAARERVAGHAASAGTKTSGRRSVAEYVWVHGVVVTPPIFDSDFKRDSPDGPSQSPTMVARCVFQGVASTPNLTNFSHGVVSDQHSIWDRGQTSVEKQFGVLNSRLFVEERKLHSNKITNSGSQKFASARRFRLKRDWIG